MTELFLKLLQRRGVGKDFLSPKYEDLEDPFLLEDMDRAVARIIEAGEKGEKVLIYGDYDVDGITASVVMKEALGFAGVQEVEILLPDRFTEGYGMNMGAVKKIKKSGASLVVTVDCGSGSGEVIADLKRQGVDCIVTDHHEIHEITKDAIAVVNPKRGEVGRDLAGVGVAFKVAVAVKTKLEGGCDGQEKWLLDLVAIGTVCDSMMLLGENRILVFWGMRVLAKTRRPGLKELMRLTGVKSESLTTQNIGFQIGPRLNAGGRMTTARKALDLVLSESAPKAFKLAKELDELNCERRKVQREVVAEATGMVVEEDPVIVVEGDWHEGIVGIVAGRLTEQWKRPSFVLARTEKGLLKGSGRSFGEFNLADCIIECKNILVAGGGHSYACGVKIAKSDFGVFSRQVNGFYKSLGLKDQQRFLRQKADLDIRDLDLFSLEFWEEVQQLEPFGEGNPEPVFRLVGMRIVNMRKIGEDDQHLKLELEDEKGESMSLVAFFAEEAWFGLNLGEQIDVDVNLLLNEWRGIKTLEGRVLAIEKGADI